MGARMAMASWPPLVPDPETSRRDLVFLYRALALALNSVLLDERVAADVAVVWVDLELGEGTGHSERSRRLICHEDQGTA